MQQDLIRFCYSQADTGASSKHRFIPSEGDEVQIAWSLFKDQGYLIEAKVSA
jgi:hypothetical protein